MILVLAYCATVVYSGCADEARTSTCQGWKKSYGCKNAGLMAFLKRKCAETCDHCGPFVPQCKGCKNTGNAVADVAKDCVAAHNKYRHKLEGTGDVVWDEQIADGALYWAKHIAETGNFEHEATVYGENLFMSGTTHDTISATCEDAVKAWYSEIKDWVFTSSKSNGGVTGHFTQVVWKGTKKIGVGFQVGKNKVKMGGHDMTVVYVVGRYDPPGNMQGAYADNVGQLAAKRDESDDIELQRSGLPMQSIQVIADQDPEALNDIIEDDDISKDDEPMVIYTARGK